MSRLNFSKLTIPIILLAVYLAVFLILKEFHVSAREVIAHASSVYAKYGYEIIFAGALMEALVIINFFLPGVTLVVLGAIFARGGGIDLTLAVLAATSGTLLGYMIDFLIGYFGFGELINRLGYSSSLKKAKDQIERSRVKSFGLGFIHPDLGSFLSLAAGTTEMNFMHFLVPATLSTLAWTSVWGLLVFAFGGIFLRVLTRYTSLLVILVLSIWVMLTLYEKRKEEK